MLVDRYQKPLFSFLASRVGNSPQAEEAAQESFVRAFLSLKKLRKPESFYSWLLGIAGRVVKEQFRSEVRRRQDPEVAETMMTNAADHNEDYPLEEVIAVLPENLSSGDSAAVLRGAFLSGSGHTPRHAAGHRHQNALASLRSCFGRNLKPVKALTEQSTKLNNYELRRMPGQLNRLRGRFAGSRGRAGMPGTLGCLCRMPG